MNDSESSGAPSNPEAELNEEIQSLKAENAKLKEDQFLFHTLLDNVGDSVYFKDKDSKFMRLSTSLGALFGLMDIDEAIDKSDYDFFDKSHADKAFNDEQEIIKTGKPKVAMEEDLTMMDGRKRWDSSSKIPLIDKDGETIGIFGISRDITIRKTQELELQTLLNKLKHENRKLQSTLSYVSHHLMSPVGKAADLACVLREQPDRAQQHSDSMLKYLQQAMSLFSDLSDYASIQSGNLILHRAKFIIFDLFREIRPKLKSWVNMKELHLHFNIPRDLQVKADCKYIGKVLHHVIMYSILETPKGGDITLEAKQEGEHVCISVSDTADPYPTHINAILNQEEIEIDEESETPLGVLLASELIKLHETKIVVQSEKGKGNYIHFNLPSV